MKIKTKEIINKIVLDLNVTHIGFDLPSVWQNSETDAISSELLSLIVSLDVPEGWHSLQAI